MALPKTCEGDCASAATRGGCQGQEDQQHPPTTLRPFLTGCQKLWLGGRKWFASGSFSSSSAAAAAAAATTTPAAEGTDQPPPPLPPLPSSLAPLAIRGKEDPAAAIQDKYRGGIPRRIPDESPPHLMMMVHSRADFVHYLIPNQRDILHCPFYWGKMDRYRAEALLANQPEGSFLLRDSAQEDFVFSVSFRRYNRTLHARIEEESHKYSFDRHDPGIHSSLTVIGLLNFYQDPLCCMFFEPLLVRGIPRTKPFSLQSICRAAVCDRLQTYDGVNSLPIPRTLKEYLREYHYKHKIRTRNYDAGEGVTVAARKSNLARTRKGF